MRKTALILMSLPFTLIISTVNSQSITKSENRCREQDIPHYTAFKISDTLTIDGKLDEKIWENASRSNRFTDLISGAATYLDTRAAVLWDDQYLYVGYWIEEPHVTAKLTKRDAPIYKDNDVELFIAGPDGYYEFEINSFGTIYEVLFFWMDAYEKNGYHLLPEFSKDAAGAKLFNGVGYKHPRGNRIGFWKWDMPGLRSAVHVEGSINNDTDKDKGWTVEIAIPWTSLKILAEGDRRVLPPSEGDVWRMDFSRFNVKKGSDSDSGGWAWSSHEVWDSHVPECFTYIGFLDKNKK
ncbi:MAG: carbohydrate-binding family 9-like protein [Chitinophagaceae bacterium]